MAVTTDDIKARVADALHLPGAGSLQPWWTEVCADALDAALADIRGALAGRGYTRVQLDAWPQLDPWVRDQALYWALVRGGALEGFDDKFVKALDHREQVKTVVVTDSDGTLVRPAIIGHGPMKGDEDVFFEDGKWRHW
jgi:hypothetical protein